MTSPPVEAILRVPRGATWVIRWPVLDPAGGPLNLTGWSAVGQVRAWYGGSTVLADLDVTAGADGHVVCRFDAAETAAWGFDSAVYGVELANPDGDRFPLAVGPIFLSPEVVV